MVLKILKVWNQWAYLGMVSFLTFCDLRLILGFWILKSHFLVCFLSFEKHDQKQKLSSDNFGGSCSLESSKSGHSLWGKKCLWTLRGNFLVWFLKISIKTNLDNFGKFCFWGTGEEEVGGGGKLFCNCNCNKISWLTKFPK